MPSIPANSRDLARYLEASDRAHHPWLLAQLRLAKLQERRHALSPGDYARQLADIHRDLMALGEWWVGREAEVFGAAAPEGFRPDSP